MSVHGQGDQELRSPAPDRPEGQERDMGSYLQDIRDIRNLLSVNHEKPVVAPWAFHSWGGLVLLGTLVNLAGYRYAEFDFHRSLRSIWVPVLILGGILESIGFIQVFRRQAPVLSSPRVIRTYLGIWGLFIAGSVILVHLIRMQAMEPGIVLVMLALFFIVYALASFQRVLVPAFGLLGLGIVFMVFGLSGPWSYGAAGLACSLAFFTGGFVCRPVKSAS